MVDSIRGLGRNAIFGNLKDFEGEIDGIRDMALKIIEKGSSHINDSERGMVGRSGKFSRFDESGVVTS